MEGFVGPFFANFSALAIFKQQIVWVEKKLKLGIYL